MILYIKKCNVGADDPVRPINNIYIHTMNNSKNVRLIKNINIEMKLKPIGKIVEKIWYKIPKIYSNTKLHSFVIMPDHIHGIIEICNNNNNNNNGGHYNNNQGRTESSATT